MNTSTTAGRPAGRPGRWLVLIGWLALVAAIAAVGSSVTMPKIPTWYAGLTKPSFSPPNWVFGPAWSVLYALMAVAAWRVSGGMGADPARRRAIGLFCLQLGLNAAWSPVFFGLERPDWALAIIVALWVALAATLAAFFRVHRWAAWLLVPYMLWITYATALNAAIVRLNP